MNERAVEIENRLNDVRETVNCISRSAISLSETLGNITSNLYDWISMIADLHDDTMEKLIIVYLIKLVVNIGDRE